MANSIEVTAAKLFERVQAVMDALSGTGIEQDPLTGPALIVLAANRHLEKGLSRAEFEKRVAAAWSAKAQQGHSSETHKFSLSSVSDVSRLQAHSLRVGEMLIRAGVKRSPLTANALLFAAGLCLSEAGMTRREYEQIATGVWDSASRALSEPQ